jgi:hypothetical protein
MNSTNGMKRVGYGYVCGTEKYIIEKLSREERQKKKAKEDKKKRGRCGDM